MKKPPGAESVGNGASYYGLAYLHRILHNKGEIVSAIGCPPHLHPSTMYPHRHWEVLSGIVCWPDYIECKAVLGHLIPNIITSIANTFWIICRSRSSSIEARVQ